MIEQLFAETQTAKLRTNIHALQLTILGAKQLDSATGGRSTVLAQDEKRDAKRDQLFDAVTVTALGWIERVKMCFKLGNQGNGIGAIGAFPRDDGGYRLSAFSLADFNRQV